ncbi:hypothetical protein TPHA_0C02230 [Tetrapisispora phaffii CBS 4417]|uniref:Thiamine transporter n=1 Tax=Tetrapisispora phaffii (strain ATCC 24235 / CBS 4417 / NBRC 1672 / NRRL Y-8282 / UCD 70-5) TaxID=1071381 RepID=G8BRK0_TETPH|nr:hypothetical protein TPHA_0C02230 [Tetrapisispora phaffii CBS 4417]CCE62376.1 hypothetical protein TPHA_0C02230 [Tetrapisispora phaffii CBS 4417]
MSEKESRLTRALRFLEIPVENRSTISILRNPDLQPIKREYQTWGFFSNFSYWGIISFSVGTWLSGSAALSVGLSYGETIGTFILGDVLTIMFTLANSYPGFDWKVGYTLSQRFVFGIYGSWFGILIRVLLSIVNYASNAWLGGLCINMILDSWSHHYLTLPNTLSHHVHMKTREVIGFCLFHVVCAACYYMKPYHIKYILIISCLATFFSMMGMVIYLSKENGGVGDAFNAPSTATGSAKCWAWVYMISYWFGSVSPGSVNQSDYSRFGSSQTAIWLGTILALLIPTTVVPVFGIIGASTSEQLYGETLWMPNEFFTYWLTKDYSAGARAASFFCGVSFVLSQIAYTISNAGFASGMDLAGLFPKYINIRRGAILTAIISVACQPWNFYNSSSIFLTVTSSFGVIMTPIITVMICDNLMIRQRQYSIGEAFKLKGDYYYTKGVNWRAMFAMTVGMAPGLPGIAWQVDNNYFNNQGIVNFYYGDSFFSFAISFFTYWIVCYFFPITITVPHDTKDYYGAFDDEVARKKGLIPYSEISEAELIRFALNSGLESESSSDDSSTIISDSHFNHESDEKNKLDGVTISTKTSSVQ